MDYLWNKSQWEMYLNILLATYTSSKMHYCTQWWYHMETTCLMLEDNMKQAGDSVVFYLSSNATLISNALSGKVISSA